MAGETIVGLYRSPSVYGRVGLIRVDGGVDGGHSGALPYRKRGGGHPHLSYGEIITRSVRRGETEMRP